jgi:hypothetical protein
VKRFLLRVALAATVLSIGSMAFATASSATAVASHWYVCKYIGPPGQSEQLQAGGNPIFVDENAIKAQTGSSTVAIGDEFPDAQGHSVVIAGPASPPGTDPEPTCPVTTPNNPPPTTPPPTTPPPRTTPPRTPPACTPAVSFGPWYGDPRVNITLTGPGTFTVTGGVQRFTGLHTITQTLACGQTYTVGRYKVLYQHSVRVYLNGSLFASRVAPSVKSIR